MIRYNMRGKMKNNNSSSSFQRQQLPAAAANSQQAKQHGSSSTVYALGTSRYIMLSSYNSCSAPVRVHTNMQQTIVGRAAGENSDRCNS